MNRTGMGQRGAALLMVILMVAIMTVLAVGVVDSVRYSSQRLSNQRIMEQAYWYALGGEQIAKFALEDAAGEGTVHLGQPWASKDILFPVEGGSIAGLIEDRQACFNINNLYRPGSSAVEETGFAPLELLRNLLLNLNLSPARADVIAARVNDWVDEDFAPEGADGAEDLFYTDKEFPYLPPNQNMVDISELNRVVEFEEGEWPRLKPFLCALPETATAININTISPQFAPLLAAALGNVVSPEQLVSVLEDRPEQGWQDVPSFLNELALSADQQPSAQLMLGLTVKSSYFRALADVFYHQRQLRLYSRLVIKNGKAVAYAREYGEVF